VFGRVRGRVSSHALAALLAAGVAIVLPAGAASAQSLFDLIFDGIRRALPDRPAGAHAPYRIAPLPLHAYRSEKLAPGPGGPRMAYCVRLCDGRYFPVQPQRSASAAVQCRSFCPASATRIFSGSGIEHAVAGDGRRYADLPNAYLYRQHIVSGCTCDGRSTTGVAPQPAAEDPTLRPGDIVATNSGLTVYRGMDPQRQAVLTPVESANISKSLRDRLVDVKVVPQPQQQPQPSSAETEPETPARDQTSAIPDEWPRLSARAP